MAGSGQPMFSTVLIAATTVVPKYGLGMNIEFEGISDGLDLPVVMMMWTGGQRSLTAAANLRASIEPGISTSVKTR